MGVSSIVGRSAKQQPSRAGARTDALKLDQTSNRGADRRSPRADERGKQFVRDRYVEQHTVGDDGAPASREVPEHEDDAIVDSPERREREL